MAKKGQKFNNHSYETKIKIVNEYLNHSGSTYSLSKKYKTLEIEKRITEIYSNVYTDILDSEIRNKPIYIKKTE